MICSTFLNIDATISFKTVRDFFLATSPSGKCDTINSDSDFHYKYSGDVLVLNYMWSKLLNIGMSSHVVTHSSPKNQNQNQNFDQNEDLKNNTYNNINSNNNNNHSNSNSNSNTNMSSMGGGNGNNSSAVKSTIPRLEVRGISQGSSIGLPARYVSTYVLTLHYTTPHHTKLIILRRYTQNLCYKKNVTIEKFLLFYPFYYFYCQCDGDFLLTTNLIYNY